MDIKVKVGTPLCQALMICFGNMSNEQIDDWLSRQDEDKNMILDVSFTVNGLEADFSKFLDFFAIAYDEMVLNVAKGIIQDKFDGLMEKMNDIGAAIDRIEFSEFGEFKL